MHFRLPIHLHKKIYITRGDMIRNRIKFTNKHALNMVDKLLSMKLGVKYWKADNLNITGCILLHKENFAFPNIQIKNIS